ncbi:ATP-binding protein [Bacillus cereus]|uniref:ATP-binding protein n=1 Tax=Bacillus cereus TaxID=1396 RepID=UPI0035CBA1F8
MLACNSMDLIQISNLDENLKVIGPIGSGKTTVLKNIALHLGKVLIFDTDGEFYNLEEQTDGMVTVIQLKKEFESDNLTKSCRISEEQMKLAKIYKHIIIDSPHHLNSGDFRTLMQLMKESNTKVISSFIKNKEFIEDEFSIKFPYIISLNGRVQ